MQIEKNPNPNPNPLGDITNNSNKYKATDSLEQIPLRKRLSAFTDVEKSGDPLQMLLHTYTDLRSTATEFVPNPPTPSATPKDSSVELKWDNISYDFNNNNYFIYVYYNDSIVKIIEITNPVHNITISKLENDEPYSFALFIIKKSDNTVTKSYLSKEVTPLKSYLSKEVTPLNPFATHFTPAAPPFTPAATQRGSGNYEQKYLKYKNKYLQLKKLKKIN